MPTTRSLRSDARENHDRVLTAAAAAFSHADGDTSMKAIAREAGVGVGTLYRRFSSREQLIEAVYRSETERLANTADKLIDKLGPLEALRSWFGQFLDYMLTKNGMADALPAILAGNEGLRTGSRNLLRSAVSRMLTAGADDNSVRTDVEPDDVLMAVGGIAMISSHEDDTALGRRLTDLLCDSLVLRRS